MSTDVRMSLSGLQLHGYTVIAGLGGRAITKASLTHAVRGASPTSSTQLTFIDLDWGIVNRELEREAQRAAAGRPPRTCCATSARSPRRIGLTDPS